jgi:hypothetical protein
MAAAEPSADTPELTAAESPTTPEPATTPGQAAAEESPAAPGHDASTAGFTEESGDPAEAVPDHSRDGAGGGSTPPELVMTHINGAAR